MSPGLRKLALTIHVTCSVGWLGAVAAFLALSVVGLNGSDDAEVRGAYVAMELTATYVIVPLSFAAPLTGIVQGLGTTWGVFRHYWVIAKLIITIPATGLLLLHMRPIGWLARAATDGSLAGGDLGRFRVQLVVNAAAAIVVLLAATALSVYKPRGVTRYGQRKQAEQTSA